MQESASHSQSKTMPHPPNQRPGSTPTTLSTILTTTSTRRSLTNASQLRQPPAFAPTSAGTPVGAAKHITSELNPETAGTMPPPPNMISLHCLCEGYSSVFPVQVWGDTTIPQVVEQVQKMAGLGGLNFVELELWKVDIDLTSYKHNFRGLQLLKVEEDHHERLASWETVSEYWSDYDLMRQKRLHILVRFSPIDCESQPLRKRRRIEEVPKFDLVDKWMSKRAKQPIPPIQDLLGFIQQPLSDEEKIPIPQERYDQLISSSYLNPCDANDVQALFRIGIPDTHSRIEPIIHATLFNPDVNGTESSYHHIWDTNIRSIIEVLERSGTSNRDSSRSTETRKLRPDYSFILKKRCPFRGEEKAPDNPEDPKAELGSKLEWAYDPAPYVLGYYCRGTEMTLVALLQPDLPHRHPVVHDLVSVNLKFTKDRILNVCHLINLASLLDPLAGMIKSPDEFLTTMRDNCNIEISGTHVVKRYTCGDGGTRIVLLQATYNLLKERLVPNVDQLLYVSKMTVHLTPRGIAQQPTSETELRQCMTCVLETLIAIHDIPFYHRDLRWNNVIRRIEDPSQWLLIDWEDAAAPPTKAQNDFSHSNHSPAVFEDGHGTEVDIWGVGNLLVTCTAVIPANLRLLGTRICQESTLLTAQVVHKLLEMT